MKNQHVLTAAERAAALSALLHRRLNGENTINQADLLSVDSDEASAFWFGLGASLGARLSFDFLPPDDLMPFFRLGVELRLLEHGNTITRFNEQAKIVT